MSRELLVDPAGLSLRAVAQKMGITAPALYRYVDNYQDLVQLVAGAIDADTAALLVEARDSQPADDPAAQIICAAIAFRRWALSNRQEFSIVFANPITAHDDARTGDQIKEEQTGAVFTELLVRLWERYRFPVPAVDELDPAVAATLCDPVMPGQLDIPEEARGLLWVFTRSWVALYGTVTLEVFGHCDPRVIRSGALFRAMLTTQAEMLGMVEELPRLGPMIDRELTR